MVDLYDLDLDCASDLRAHGAQVAHGGGDKAECPVAPSHPHWSVWQLAWSKARSLDQSASGAMAYRTSLMKAEVRRQMEGLHEYGPDPAAEVAPPPQQRGGLSHHGGHVHLNITVSTEAFKAAMQQAANAFSEAIDNTNRVFESASTDLQALFDQMSLVDWTPDVQRLRHGSAAACPRHGQTKGGTCMKCARRRG